MFSKDFSPHLDNLDFDEEKHNKPSNRRKTQQELEAQMKKIEQKNEVYNMICEPNSYLNIDGGLRLQQIFSNIQQLLGEDFVKRRMQEE